MKEFIKNLKFTWKYVKKLKGKLIKYCLLNIMAVIISIIVPLLSARLIVELTSNNFHQLLLIGMVMFLVEITRNIIDYFTRYYSQIIYREGLINIKTALGSEIVKIESKCIDSNSSGLFVQRLSEDTSNIADIFNVLNVYLSQIITYCGIFIAILIINKVIFLYCVFMIFVLFLINKLRVKKINVKDKIFRKKKEDVSGFTSELVRGLRDIKMLNAEKNFVDEMHKKVKDLNMARYDMSKTERDYSFVQGSVTDFFNLGSIVLAVGLLLRGILSIPNALIIYNYMSNIAYIIYYLGNLMDGIRDFNLSSTRIFEIIDSTTFPKETFGLTHLKKVNGNFTFENVDFQYDQDGNKILDNISFKVKANQTVAFVGKSGAGKSTIFSLLCKLYDPTGGTITIDGVDIKKLDKDTIRGNITIISQNPYIFHLSIRDNLRLVKNNLTEKEMIKACKLACLHDFIMSLPSEYDTIIGEGGVNLSGGQKQRLAIARAFIQKTEIILFDEATSALDNETQNSIKQAIDNMKKDYTILIIAHRLSTVIDSDNILFLKDGKINDQGSHEVLLKKNKEYKKLYEAELKTNN